MSLDTTVKYFDSSMTGAPTLANVAGNLIAVLDACLVNGFGLITATSVVVAGGVGTATFGSTPPGMAQCVAYFDGATPSAINGEHKILSVVGNVVTFDATGIADCAATGTITMKLAPAGWSKAFSGTNLAAYKSNNVQSTQNYLYVGDTTTTYATVRGYEAMTAIDAGTYPFPTTSQQSASMWPKASSSVAKNWFIIANDRFFYFGVAPYASYTTNYMLYAFGDIVGRKSGDAFRCSLWATNSDASSQSNAYNYSPILTWTGSYYSCYCARPFYGVGAPAALTKTWLDYASSSTTMSGLGSKSFPNPVDNGVLFNEIFALEGAGYRGTLPGIYASAQNVGTGITDKSQFYVGEIERTLMWRVSAAQATYIGGCFFDITGPWSH